MDQDKKTMTREEMMADIEKNRELKLGLMRECGDLEKEYNDIARQKGLDLNAVKEQVDIGED